jgi:hypothetical protein
MVFLSFVEIKSLKCLKRAQTESRAFSLPGEQVDLLKSELRAIEQLNAEFEFLLSPSTTVLPLTLHDDYDNFLTMRRELEDWKVAFESKDLNEEKGSSIGHHEEILLSLKCSVNYPIS